jgi:hypothetical protein
MLPNPKLCDGHAEMHNTLLLDDWLTEGEAAAELKKTPRTLQSWRQKRIGPAWSKNGNVVLYHRDALREYLFAGVVRPSGQKQKRK